MPRKPLQRGVTLTSTVPVQTSVPASLTSVVLFASNDNAIDREIRNDSVNNLWVSEGVAATTSAPILLYPGDYMKFDWPVFTGIVYGIWDGTDGAARCQEKT